MVTSDTETMEVTYPVTPEDLYLRVRHDDAVEPVGSTDDEDHEIPSRAKVRCNSHNEQAKQDLYPTRSIHLVIV